VLERALVLCEGDAILPEHLPLEKMRAARGGSRPTALPAGDPAPIPAGASLSAVDAVERQRVFEVMAQVGGNQTRAAKILGMARGTLIERLKRYGIRRPQVGGE
jgi:DNA-binding NtrC family response regulator